MYFFSFQSCDFVSQTIYSLFQNKLSTMFLFLATLFENTSSATSFLLSEVQRDQITKINSPPVTLFGLPNDIHFQLSKLLLPRDILNLCQTCVALQNIYQGLYWKKCTSHKLLKPNPLSNIAPSDGVFAASLITHTLPSTTWILNGTLLTYRFLNSLQISQRYQYRFMHQGLYVNLADLHS